MKLLDEERGVRLLNNKEPTKRLTEKQEKFVQNLLLGQSQREAYKNSYSASRMLDRTIDNKAYIVFARDDVRARYDEIKDRVVKDAETKGILTAVEVLKTITDIIADTKGEDPKASLKGLELLGKYHKLFTDKIEHSGEVSLPNFNIKGK